MKYTEMLMLMNYHKAMSDENRLKVTSILGQKECNVSELAQLLGLSEPTVSHHLSKLRAAGLVNLRSHGNQRFYRLTLGRIEHMNALALRLASEPLEAAEAQPDDSWIDELKIDDWAKKVMRDYFSDRRLRQIPTKPMKLIVVLDFLITQFETDHDYSEKEVNEILTRFHEDYATLRRELINMEYLEREPTGSRYWVSQESEMHTQS